MNLYITLTTAGVDTGPFNIYSNVDGYLSAFETNISRATLLAGFSSSNAPEGTTEIKVVSVNSDCNNSAISGTLPLVYYWIDEGAEIYLTDFIVGESSSYVYGGPGAYYNGSYTVPGNYLFKINSDLSYATEFDTGSLGFNQYPYTGASLYLQNDGRLIVMGSFTTYNGVFNSRIIRLNPDGSIDNTFNSGTGFNNFTEGILLDSFGNMFILGLFATYDGYTSPRLVKLLPDGSKDTSFNIGAGFNNTTISGVMLSDNSMVISGYFTSYKGVTVSKAIIKLLPNGNVDPSFNGGTGYNNSVGKPIFLSKIDGDPNILTVGDFTTYKGVSYGYMVKIQPNGSPDAAFTAVQGTGFNALAWFNKVIWGNKYLIKGSFNSYNGYTSYGAIILNQDGTIHHVFNTWYTAIYVVGQNLYGTLATAIPGEPNQLIYTFADTPPITTTTTTTVPPTTTTTTTI